MLINHHNLAMNRIKAVLAEKQLTARWLAAELGKKRILFLAGAPIKCNHPYRNYIQ